MEAEKGKDYKKDKKDYKNEGGKALKTLKKGETYRQESRAGISSDEDVCR